MQGGWGTTYASLLILSLTILVCDPLWSLNNFVWPQPLSVSDIKVTCSLVQILLLPRIDLSNDIPLKRHNLTYFTQNSKSDSLEEGMYYWALYYRLIGHLAETALDTVQVVPTNS